MVVGRKPHYVLLLDENRARLAMFELATDPRYNRKVNTASELRVTIPRDEDAIETGAMLTEAGDRILTEAGDTILHVRNLSKLALVRLARFLHIYHGETRKATGVITRRDLTDDVANVRGYTEEILLERHLSPLQYGAVYQNLDLADAVRLTLDGWYALQVATGEDWGRNISTRQVDIATEPGQVLLAINDGVVYFANGDIIMRFDKTLVPGFKSWERIRWVSDYDEVVQTTMAYRASNTPIADPAAGWSQEFVGGLPDTLGVVIAATDERFVDVRMTLVTQDTTTPDDDNNPTVFGFTPRAFALQLIARTFSGITAGDIPASTGVTVRGIDADQRSQFAIIKALCEQGGYRFEVADGQVSIEEVPT